MGQEIKVNHISSIVKTEGADKYTISYQLNDDYYTLTVALLGNFSEENLDFSEDLNKVDFFANIKDIIPSQANRLIHYTFTYEAAPVEANDTFMILGWLIVYKMMIRRSVIRLNIKFMEILHEDVPITLAEFPREEFEMALQKYILG